MKLSLAWIFDHIDADWKAISIEEIVKKINSTTAEIESYKKLTIDLKSFELARVISIGDKITLNIIDLNKEIILSNRLDAKVDDLFLIKKTSDKFAWATLHDLGSEKEGLIPNLFINDISNWK